MKCPYCKKEIEVNMTFCPHCMSVLKDADVEEFLKVDEIESEKDPKDVSIKDFITEEEITEEPTEEIIEKNETIEEYTQESQTEDI